MNASSSSLLGILVSIIFLSLTNLSHANSETSSSFNAPMPVDLSKASIPINPHLEVYVSESSEEPIEVVENKNFIPRKEFSKGNKNGLTYWLRFSTDKIAYDSDLRYALVPSNSGVSILDVYIKDASGKIQFYGDFGYKSKKFNDHWLDIRPFVPMPSFQPHNTFFIKLKSARIPRVAFQLYEINRGRMLSDLYNLLCYLMVAGFFVLAIYNFLIYLVLKDRGYLFYTLFCFLTLLHSISFSSILDHILQIQNFFMADYSNLIIIPTSLAMILFMRDFLNLNASNLKLSKIVMNFVKIGMMIESILLLIPKFAFIQLIVTSWYYSNIVLCIYAAIKSYRMGYRPARTYLLAWGTLMPFTVTWVFLESGVIESTSIFANFLGGIGSILSLIIMSVALAQRFQILEQKAILLEVKEKESYEMRSLIRILCHDLANPLSVIKFTFHSLLKDQPQLKALIRGNRATQVIEEIIINIRNLESAKNNRKEIVLEKLDLEEVFKDVEVIFQNKLNDKKIRYEFKIKDEKARYILADKTNFTNQVLCNLISNAIKFTKEEGEIQVNSKYDSVHDKVVLTCEDSGIGMPEKMIKEIFNPAAKISRLGTNKELGTGFGMPIVAAFIKNFQGEIELFSNEAAPNVKSGTTFRLTFPRYK